MEDDESEEISERSSMVGNATYGEEQADVNEAVLSILTVQDMMMLASQSSMLMVTFSNYLFYELFMHL